MDYNKLSSITDSVNKPQTPKLEKRNVADLEVEKPASVLDKINTKVRIGDSAKEAKVKYVFIDDAFIAKVMGAPRAQKRAYLSKLTDAQRRRLLDRWSQIKDASVTQLDLVNCATLLQNAIFNPNEYNKNLLKEFVEAHGEEEFNDIKQLYEWIESDALNYEDPSQKEVIDRVVKMLDDNGVKNSIHDALNIVSIEDSAEIPEEIRKKVEASAKDLAEKYIAGSIGLSEVITGVDNIVWPCVNDFAFDSQKLEEIVNNKFNETVNASREQLIRDSVIDKIAESDLLDDNGDPVSEETKPTVVELLSEALEDFVNGDSSKLENLSKIQVEGATVSLDTSVKEDESEEGSGLGSGDLDLDLDSEIDVEDENLGDSVDFARALLKKSYADIARLEDSLRHKVAALSKYSFKVQDYTPATPCSFEQQVGVVNPPLTHDEYHSIRPEVPGYIGQLAKQGNPVQIPPTATIERDGDYLNVTFNGVTQKWMPIVGSVEDIDLDAPQNEVIQAVQDGCVPVYDAHKAAALTNNLDVIDSRFYKKHLNDCTWAFDEVPQCLSCVEGVTPECSVTPCYGVSPTEGVLGEVEICGQKYLIIKA